MSKQREELEHRLKLRNIKLSDYEDIREIMAQLGIRSFNELIGRADLLDGSASLSTAIAASRSAVIAAARSA